MPQTSAQAALLELQKAQQEHDESFHREIARLDVARRLTHMALHVSKYFARLCQTEFAGRNDASSKAIAHQSWLDTFIIATSTSNILNQKLSDAWGVHSPDIAAADIHQWLDRNADRLGISEDKQLTLAQIVEQLSNACEKIDHLERVSYRDEIGAAVGRLSALSFCRLSQRNRDVAALVHERLLETKRKNIFFS